MRGIKTGICIVVDLADDCTIKTKDVKEIVATVNKGGYSTLNINSFGFIICNFNQAIDKAYVVNLLDKVMSSLDCTITIDIILDDVITKYTLDEFKNSFESICISID